MIYENRVKGVDEVQRMFDEKVFSWAPRFGVVAIIIAVLMTSRLHLALVFRGQQIRVDPRSKNIIKKFSFPLNTNSLSL